jgi:hypothetical protein
MTTIVASIAHKCMAADAKATTGLIHFGVYKLRTMPDGSLIGCAGDWGTILKFYKFMEWGEDLDDDLDIEAMKLDFTGLHLFDFKSQQFYPIRQKFFAIGSGAGIALGVMAMGGTPQQAIEAAGHFDEASGPPYDILTLKRRRNATTKNTD